MALPVRGLSWSRSFPTCRSRFDNQLVDVRPVRSSLRPGSDRDRHSVLLPVAQVASGREGLSSEGSRK